MDLVAEGGTASASRIKIPERLLEQRAWLFVVIAFGIVFGSERTHEEAGLVGSGAYLNQGLQRLVIGSNRGQKNLSFLYQDRPPCLNLPRTLPFQPASYPLFRH